jgi:hypothetical protein
MQNNVKLVEVTRTPSKAFQMGTRLRNAVVFAPFALATLAGAQSADITAMAGNAQSGVDAIKTAVVGLVGVIVVIGLLVWGAKHLKPKG